MYAITKLRSMKKYYKATGFSFIIIGLISIIILFANGFHFYNLGKEIISLLVFPAIALPAIGFRIIKKHR